MSRQARMLVILAAFALVAVVALGAMARKYSRLIEARPSRPAAGSADRP